MRYVALLRGVNVGGKHRLPKQDFQAALEQLGCYDVTIYINSGNAVFSSNAPVQSSQVQQALESRFGFDIPTLVLPATKITAIAQAIPDGWTNDPPRPDKSGQKSDVIYLFKELNTPEVLTLFGYNSAVETMLYVDGAVITNILRANQTKGSLQKIASSPLYAQVTIRNVNTARKLAELI